MQVSTHIDQQVGFIHFSNPPLHYMTADMLEGIYNSFHQLLKDDSVKVIVLRNPTKGFFITHYSLDEIEGLRETGVALKKVGFDMAKRAKLAMKIVKVIYKCAKWPILGGLFLAVAKLFHVERAFAYVIAINLIKEVMLAPKPVIAMIDGNAQGYGMELSLACDFRVMAKGDYHLGQIEALVGLMPGATGMHNLCNIVGSAKALELSMLSTRLKAEEAEKLGLIYKAVDEDNLMAETMRLGKQLAKRSSLSLKHIKYALQKGRKLPIEKAVLNDEVAFTQTTLSDTSKEVFDINREILKKGKSVNEAFDELQDLNLT